MADDIILLADRRRRKASETLRYQTAREDQQLVMDLRHAVDRVYRRFGEDRGDELIVDILVRVSQEIIRQ
jgi:hypothetical protein